jgi:hypothetical protein
MHITEVKKGEAEIKRGLVMMAIEGTREQLDTIEKLVSYPSTQCRDEVDGDIFADYYMIRRNQKIDFVAEYKAAKKIIKL